MATPPHPGTAVNAAARSIVSRMKRRLSAAWASIATGSRVRRGLAEAMIESLAVDPVFVKYFVT
jgi:hypothetical protein